MRLFLVSCKGRNRGVTCALALAWVVLLLHCSRISQSDLGHDSVDECTGEVKTEDLCDASRIDGAETFLALRTESAVGSPEELIDFIGKTDHQADAVAFHRIDEAERGKSQLDESGEDKNATASQYEQQESSDLPESIETQVEVNPEEDHTADNHKIRIPPISLNEYRTNMASQMQRALHCNIAAENQGTDNVGIRHRVETGGEEYNFAAASHGAKLVAANKEAKGAGSILQSDKEKYYRSPCSAEEKFVIVELSEETLIDVFVIANFEIYSANLKEFELFGSLTYPADEWRLLGKFEAENARHAQKFRLAKPEWVRYLKLKMLSHYGTEFYCTLSTIEVYGIDAIECLLEEWVGVGKTASGRMQPDHSTHTLQVPTSFGRNLKETHDQDKTPKLEDRTDSIRNIIDNYAQPSRLGDSVMKLLMQKVKALEMNQTLFDRYVEDLNSNYKTLFGEYERDLGVVNNMLANLTSSLSSLVTLIRKTERDREVQWKQFQSKLLTHVNNEATHLEEFRGQIQHMENREMVAMTLAFILILVSSLRQLLGRCMTWGMFGSPNFLLFCTGCVFAVILCA